MPSEPRDPERLSRALEIALQWREAGGESTTELFERHPDLADLLELLLTDQTAAPPAADQPARVGDFTIDVELGRGSMGVVYAAEQDSLGRRVALKLMHGSAASSERLLARFRREAVLTARLEHPHIVRLLEFGVDDGRPFFAMELIDGAPLSRVYEATRSGQPFGAALTTMTGQESRWPENSHRALAMVGSQIARALQHAHDHGVVHRDVKPSNLLVRADGIAQLADFGIARERGLPSLTATGEFAGTPYYVSPEQIKNDDATALDGRADIFSLGATLYEGLAHRPPFEGDSSHQVLERILDTEPSDPRRHDPSVPVDLAAIVMKAIEKAPGQRYENARRFAEDLESFAAGHPVRARPISPPRRLLRRIRRSPIAALAVTGALLAIGLLAYLFAIEPDARLGAETRVDNAIEPLVRAGFAEAAKGSARRADQLFRRAIALDHQREDVWIGLALAWISAHQPHRALEVLAEAPTFDNEAARRSLERLRAVAHHGCGNDAEVAAIEAALGPCETAWEWFVVGMDSITRGHHSRNPTHFVRGRDSIDRAIAIAPGPNLLFHTQRAHAAGHLLNPADGKLWAGILLEQWPESPQALFFAAFALRPFERERSIDLYRRAYELRDSQPLFAEHYADALRKLDRFDEAIAVMQEADRRWANSGYVKFRLAETLLRAGKGKAARPVYEAALAVEGLRALPDEHRGIALVRIRRFEEARTFLERRLEVSPRRHQAWVELSLAYIYAGDWDGGITVLERAVKMLPESADLWFRLGDCRRRQRRIEPAIAALRRVQAIDPDHVRALNLLSSALVQTDRYDEAIEVLDHAIQLPGVPVSAVCRRANMHRVRQEVEQARALYERAEALDPEYPDTYYHRAALEQNVGNYELAAEFNARAIETSPRMLGPARDGALLLERMERIDDARHYYRLALELQPKDRSLHVQYVNFLRRQELDAELDAEEERWEQVNQQPKSDADR